MMKSCLGKHRFYLELIEGIVGEFFVSTYFIFYRKERKVFRKGRKEKNYKRIL
jgi:hypothetical protein